MKKQLFPSRLFALLAFSLVLFFSACGGESTEETPSYTDTEETSETSTPEMSEEEREKTESQEKIDSYANQDMETLLGRLKWMDGNWQSNFVGQTNDPQNSFYEEWKAPKMGLKLGFAYQLKDGMTQNGLDKQIKIDGETLVYVQGKEGQEGYAEYPMKEADKSIVIFENLENPFPQTIQYSGEKEGILLVTISGKDPESGKDVEMESQYVLAGGK